MDQTEDEARRELIARTWVEQLNDEQFLALFGAELSRRAESENSRAGVEGYVLAGRQVTIDNYEDLYGEDEI
jgi:hypothetical protein